ncbi:unnamed protein product [Mytilus edulis]|uniref:Uncharacterized protein n=1 Tax=Mytilus edulis TaxID=6550 RepID=A0A8S3SFD5_MYTED|nr:unnamed protein product [Mytilus edulis]
MAVSRAQSETGSVVNTKFGARPIIDLPAFAYGVGKNNYMSSNLADVPPRMFGPTEYSYNVGKNVPRDHSNGGYVGQYYNQSPRGYQNSPTSNLVNESNVLPYPSYTTVPNMAAQQLPMPPQGPNMAAQQPPMPPQGQMAQPYGGQGNETHLYYGPNGERLPGPPSEMFRPRPQYTTNRRQYPTNFKIEGTLEYGKMVSIRIKEGNVSFRDIPDSVLANCHKTYRMIPRTDVTIEAENGEYNVYASPDVPSPMLRHQGYMYDPNKSYSNARRATVYPRSFSQIDKHHIMTFIPKNTKAIIMLMILINGDIPHTKLILETLGKCTENHGIFAESREKFKNTGIAVERMLKEMTVVYMKWNVQVYVILRENLYQ